jgi:hypothetical protein
LRHEILVPDSFALPSAGSNKAARLAIMAITTRSSIKVKAVEINFPAGWRDQRFAFMKGLCVIKFVL